MTAKTTIRLPRTLVNELLHEAQLSPQQEISGLIGRHGQRCMCYPVDSVKTDASVLFALSASEQFAARNERTQSGTVRHLSLSSRCSSITVGY